MGKRKLPHHVLPVIPGSALELLEQKCDRTSGAKTRCSRPQARDSIDELGNLSSSRFCTRRDQPSVIYCAFGSRNRALAASSSDGALNTAVCSLERDFHSATSKAPRDSRLKTWEIFHEQVMGDAPLVPVTRESLLKVSALFKAGRYRSFPNYLCIIKELHIKSDFIRSQLLERYAKDCERSVARGLSGMRARSEAFEFDKAMAKCRRAGINVKVLKAPFGTYALVCLGTWFLCREVELSGALARELVVSEQGLRISFTLPASKTDSEGKGTVQHLDCLCKITKHCPVHVLSEYLQQLEQHFVTKGGRDFAALPLFPRADGTPLSKASVVNVLRQMVKAYGGRIQDEVGRYLISGHAFRITGARMLASLGLDPITIGLHGRWSSNAILTYLGEAPLVSVSRRLRILTGVDPALQALSKRVASLEEAFASSDESSEDEVGHSS